MAVLERARPRTSRAASPRPANGERVAARARWPNGTQRLLLHNIDWPTYDTLLHALDERNLHLTYDRGTLEIMALSPEHERQKSLLRLTLYVLSEEFDVPLTGFGSTTFRRKDADRGLEPDECFFIGKFPDVRGKRQYDLAVDPPPDLAVEVEVSRSCLDRMRIFAAIGVSEVWRFNGQTLLVCRLMSSGEYETVQQSEYFPTIPLHDLARHIRRGRLMIDSQFTRSLRSWVRRLASKRNGGKKK